MPKYNGGFIGTDGLDAPDEPTIGTPSVGSAQADIAFTAPSDVGTSAITEYVATTNDGIGATGTSSPITITGLTNNTSYTARVYAKNAYGTSAASEASASFTPLAEIIDSLFQTHLYTGVDDTDQTITNGINLSVKGGLVWIKNRDQNDDHALYDTERGIYKYLESNQDGAETSNTTHLKAFNSNGFTIGPNLQINTNTEKYVSWTFRKQPKFFDIVTWTGNGTEDRTISHNLGSVPGMIIVKGYSLTEDWNVYHRGIGNAKYLQLNSTAAAANVDTGAGGANLWMSTDPTSTTFKIDEHNRVNKNGDTYVAYLFAHNNNDGGFGPDSEDIIKCGSYTGNGSDTGPEINLGFEPQWVMIKGTGYGDATGGDYRHWYIYDMMRGNPVQDSSSYGGKTIKANESSNESGTNYNPQPTPTGFKLGANRSATNYNGETYIYMAIRRGGGMSTPTDPDDVFQAHTYTGDGSTRKYSLNITPDFVINASRTVSGDSIAFNDRLRGSGKEMYSSGTGPHALQSTGMQFDHTNGIEVQNYRDTNSENYLNLCWKRAKGFFDIVTYTGTGTAGFTVNHKLGVAPEMTWIKRTDSSTNWRVNVAALGTNGQTSPVLKLNSDGASEDDNGSYFGNNNSGGYTAPTSSVLTLGGHGDVNTSGGTHIAYLFATIADVSKVGTYTGNSSSSQNIDCGFTTQGVEFLLIKSTSSGDWFVWTRGTGIVSGNDPYIRLNQAANEVTNTDHIDTFSTGFTVNSDFNVNSEVYIFYAIAR